MSQRRGSPQGPDDPQVGGSSGRGILLLAIAVVLGIVVLQATDTDSPDANVSSGPSDTETTSTTTGASATTIRALRPSGDVKVLPANGTQLSGLGSRVGDILKGGGYTDTLSAVDATTNTVQATQVLYTPDFGPEAQVIAAVLGLPVTAVKPVGTPPVRDTRGADVIVLVGTDLQRAGGGGSSPTTAGTATTTTTG